ncbi:MAG: glycerate kinase [Micromonosporaceae bacterium]|nr:glycerate kinase [Micromonosporaceae bacterium]
MRVLICPDKFAGTISAVDAAAALAAGWRGAAPGDQLVARPLADGGPGFLEVVAAATGGRRQPVPTVDPLGRPVDGWVLVTGRTTAYLESAQACGLQLLAPAERDPTVTSSYGLGQLLAAAVATGARELVVGLGGSATNDAGAGMLAALGAPAVDAAGHPLPPGGAALAEVAGLAGVPRLGGVSLVAATDVDHPLLGPDGATATFAPQKGATAQDLVRLEKAVGRFAAVLERDLPGCPAGLAGLPGGGAAGGLGAALLALGGRRESGIGLVRALTGLDEALATADLVITGEGSFDHQSVRGKVVAGVAAAARDRGVPCLVVAGRVTVGRAEAAAAGVTEAHSLVDLLGSVEAAMAIPADGLRALGAQLAGAWSST